MKTQMARITLALFLTVSVVSLSIADPPQLGDTTPGNGPQIAFIDLSDGVNLFDSVNIPGVVDVALLIPGGQDEFLRLGPDASTNFLHAADNDAACLALIVTTSGEKFFTGPCRARTSGLVFLAGGDNNCPINASAIGTVRECVGNPFDCALNGNNLVGPEFNLRYNVVTVQTPEENDPATPGDESCARVLSTLTVTP